MFKFRFVTLVSTEVQRLFLEFRTSSFSVLSTESAEEIYKSLRESRRSSLFTRLLGPYWLRDHDTWPQLGVQRHKHLSTALVLRYITAIEPSFWNSPRLKKFLLAYFFLKHISSHVFYTVKNNGKIAKFTRKLQNWLEKDQ